MATGPVIRELEKELAVEFWPELQPYVVQALSYDPYLSITPADVLNQVQQGYARVLIAVEDEDEELLSATVVQLFKSIKGDRVLHVLTTAGDNVDKWLPALIHKFNEIAEKENCARVTMSGRPGWAKKINRYGFKVAHVTMEMKVEGAINGRVQQVGK